MKTHCLLQRSRFFPAGLLITLGCILPALSTLPGCGIGGYRLRSPIARDSGEAQSGPGKLSSAQIQSEVMSFTDTFNSAISEAYNAVAAEARAESDPAGLAAPTAEQDRDSRVRRSALESKLVIVSSALSIASSPNPSVALADMITMVTLQRMVLESPQAIGLYGEKTAAALAATFKKQEDKVWAIAHRAMEPAREEELTRLITDWRTDNPDTVYVSNVRLEDFAKHRTESRVSESSSQSLLSMLALDPLAGLEPAQRDLEKSRMLGERMFFYGSRMPQVIKWEVESLYQDLFRTPEFRQGLLTMSKTADSATRISAIAERLPADIANERQATVEVVFKQLGQERQAALDQVFRGLTEQRQGLLTEIDQSQGKLQGSLRELRETVVASDHLAASLTTTIQAANTLTAQVMPATPPAGTPPATSDRDALADFRAAAAQTSDAADHLAGLLKGVNELLASPAIDQKTTQLHKELQNATDSSKNVIDYAFSRLLILTLGTPFAVALAAGLYKLATRRTRV